MGTGGSFLEGNVAGVWSWQLTSIYCRGKNGGATLPLSHIFSWCGLNSLSIWTSPLQMGSSYFVRGKNTDINDIIRCSISTGTLKWSTIWSLYIPLVFIHIVTWGLKAKTVYSEETFVVRQQLCKHVSLATYIHATREELLESAFYMGPTREPKPVGRRWMSMPRDIQRKVTPKHWVST